MKAIDHHLYDRGGRYYYRSSFLRNLRPFILLHEIVLSLTTNNIGQARLYVARLDIEVEKLISGIYSTLEHSPTAEGLEIIKEQIKGCYDSLRAAVGLTGETIFCTSHAVQINKKLTYLLI